MMVPYYIIREENRPYFKTCKPSLQSQAKKLCTLHESYKNIRAMKLPMTALPYNT